MSAVAARLALLALLLAPAGCGGPVDHCSYERGSARLEEHGGVLCDGVRP